METRKIGNLEVSPIGMDCMGFSHGYGAVPEEEYSIQAIRKAYDFGGTFFDTAESYGQEMFYAGHNEQLVGKAVEPFRRQAVLATKFEGDDVRKFVLQLSKENIAANQPILDVLAKFSEKKNAANAQISLAWMLHKYPNVVPIPGSKNQERILENLGSWNVSLTDREFDELEAALAKCAVHGHRGHVESEQAAFGKNWKK